MPFSGCPFPFVFFSDLGRDFGDPLTRSDRKSDIAGATRWLATVCNVSGDYSVVSQCECEFECECILASGAATPSERQGTCEYGRREAAIN